MSRFSENYFTMKEGDALEYATSVLIFFDKDSKLSCEEIGDGNLNYVFKIKDESKKKSVILKQAGPVARISDEFKVSPDRNRIESEVLQLQYKLAEGLVPKVYSYDPIMNCFAMEDLSDHEILRSALIKHKKFPLLSEHITTFLVNTLLLTSDVVMEHKEKKDFVKKFINPELCEITEDLVYTEPFFDCPRNDVFSLTKEFVKIHIWSDEKLLLETAKLKFEFMTGAQSLLHGDLHTGSVFVKTDSTKVIDSEFAFYGPAGYDIGNIIANLIFAYVNAATTIEDQKERDSFKEWLEESIISVVDLFKAKFITKWKESARERVASYKGFSQYYLNNILRDTSAVTGCELIRRIIGLAHVKDITIIVDTEKRARAEKICLLAGKSFIIRRNIIEIGRDFMNIVKDCEMNISQY